METDLHPRRKDTESTGCLSVFMESQEIFIKKSLNFLCVKSVLHLGHTVTRAV